MTIFRGCNFSSNVFKSGKDEKNGAYPKALNEYNLSIHDPACFGCQLH